MFHQHLKKFYHSAQYPFSFSCVIGLYIRCIRSLKVTNSNLFYNYFSLYLCRNRIKHIDTFIHIINTWSPGDCTQLLFPDLLSLALPLTTSPCTCQSQTVQTPPLPKTRPRLGFLLMRPCQPRICFYPEIKKKRRDHSFSSNIMIMKS